MSVLLVTSKILSFSTLLCFSRLSSHTKAIILFAFFSSRVAFRTHIWWSVQSARRTFALTLSLRLCRPLSDHRKATQGVFSGKCSRFCSTKHIFKVWYGEMTLLIDPKMPSSSWYSGLKLKASAKGPRPKSHSGVHQAVTAGLKTSRSTKIQAICHANIMLDLARFGHICSCCRTSDHGSTTTKLQQHLLSISIYRSILFIPVQHMVFCNEDPKTSLDFTQAWSFSPAAGSPIISKSTYSQWNTGLSSNTWKRKSLSKRVAHSLELWPC